jgi:hypothetical protein
MTRANIAKLSLTASIIALVGISQLSKVNIERISDAGISLLISSADARVGRPLTPVSYAGVARRTSRRNR